MAEALKPDSLTRAELDEAKRLEAAASKGPWCFENCGDKCNDWIVGITDPPTEGYFEEDPERKTIRVEEVCEVGERNGADAEFIAFARTFVPRAIAAIESRDALLADCAEAFEEIYKYRSSHLPDHALRRCADISAGVLVRLRGAR